ncbi:MAG: hypothetical protein M1820_010217 [Bogoriella megaspora]|nr:MAG: hypothetical protein M1820_010217 [Bogoriella megaspora]
MTSSLSNLMFQSTSALTRVVIFHVYPGFFFHEGMWFFSSATSTSKREAQLRQTVYDFCQAFLQGSPPTEILDRFFVPTDPKITEHGPDWATSRLPFLGKTFEGRDGAENYFTVLTNMLEFVPSKDSFPEREGIVVDVDAESEEGKGKGVVSLKAKGKFRAKPTGKEWDEEFTYRLSGFDDEGRIGHWEIWADPLSAWMAVSKQGT